MGFFSFFSKDKKEKLDQGLTKTRDNFFSKLSKAIVGKSVVDEEVLDNIEEVLIASDVGLSTTIKIIEQLEKRISKEKYIKIEEVYDVLEHELTQLFSENTTTIEGFDFPDRDYPYVIMVVGVNGVGKTTTIGKLAHQFKNAGKKVILGAADTFRAAAVEQLTIWSERAKVDIVQQGMNADPASVAYETINTAKSKGYDVAIIDTAGRLHNKTNLMNELGKIKRVMQKVLPNAPHEILLVLDASTGQNAVEQAKQFTAVTDVNALALTKLDGTAKGGVAITITDQFNIPIKYIGLGEKIEDLQIFDKIEFVKSLFLQN
jgi:fused signal recognition particle receptor